MGSKTQAAYAHMFMAMRANGIIADVLVTDFEPAIASAACSIFGETLTVRKGCIQNSKSQKNEFASIHRTESLFASQIVSPYTDMSFQPINSMARIVEFSHQTKDDNRQLPTAFCLPMRLHAPPLDYPRTPNGNLCTQPRYKIGLQDNMA